MTTTVRDGIFEIRTGCYSRKALEILDFFMSGYNNCSYWTELRLSKLSKEFTLALTFFSSLDNYDVLAVKQDVDNEVVLEVYLGNLKDWKLYSNIKSLTLQPTSILNTIYDASICEEESAAALMTLLPKIMAEAASMIDSKIAGCEWISVRTKRYRTGVRFSKEDVAAFVDELTGKKLSQKTKKRKHSVVGKPCDMMKVAAKEQIAKLKEQLKKEIELEKSAFKIKTTAFSREYWKKYRAEESIMKAKIDKLKAEYEKTIGEMKKI